jgi:hypothetical protein
MNLLLSRFRQDQQSNGAVQSLLIPVYSLTLELLCRIGLRHTRKS